MVFLLSKTFSKWKITLGIIFMFTAFPRISIEAQSLVESRLSAAKSYIAENKLSDALAIYNRCIEMDSTQTACVKGQAETAQQLGQLLLAKNAYLKLAEDSVYQDVAWRQLASLYESDGNVPKAIKYYTFLNKADTTNAYYWRKLGQLYFGAGEVQGAFGCYRLALTYNPQDLYTIRGLAEIFLNNEQFTETDSLLRIAIQLDSTNVSSKLMLARSKYQQRAFDSAALILRPVNMQSGLTNYYSKMLGYSLLQIDSLDESIFYLRQSLVNENSPEFAEYYLGVAYDRMDDFVNAKYFYERAINSGISQNIGLYYRLLAEVAIKENDKKAAIDAFSSSFDFKKDPLSLFKLAELSADYYKDKSIAIRYYERYLKTDHDDAEYRKYAREKIKHLKQNQFMSR